MTVQTNLSTPADASAAIIFTKPGCGHGTATLRRSKEAGIAQETRDLTKNLEDAERLRRTGHLTAPVVEPTDLRISA